MKKLKSRMKSINLLLITAVILAGCSRPEHAEAQPPRAAIPSPDPVIIHKIVASVDDTVKMAFVNDLALYTEGWDTLGQPKFWRQIICLSPDSCIINVASSRTPLKVTGYHEWCSNPEVVKGQVKSTIRENYCIESTEELYVTNGKKEFYEHRKSIPTISKAVKYFVEYGVDPWYAQTILLIESPGKAATKSYAGANGPFQLMRTVAMKYGLKVNAKVDERADLKRAAYAASKLIGTICIPKVKGMLDSRNIAYNETDLWFRLLVLHAYHAGSGNVSAAMNKLNPTEGGQQLIRALWRTEAAGFKNESQNYSQIALAALLNFESILQMDKDTVFLVQGDRYYSIYQRSKADGAVAQTMLKEALSRYERDLVDGLIPFDYFIQQTEKLRTELAIVNGEPRKKDAITRAYPDDELHYINLGNELLRKRKTDDAIRLLKFNVDNYPSSAAAADSLSKAYRLKGNYGLAQKYMMKSSR